MRAFYFGCLRDVGLHTQAGHFLYNERLGSTYPGHHGEIAFPFQYEKLDGQFQPRESKQYSNHRGDEKPQGQARLTQVSGWTVLAFWDRSGDSRGASNSSFVFDQILDGETALMWARKTFPQLFERFPFEVTIVETVIPEAAL